MTFEKSTTVTRAGVLLFAAGSLAAGVLDLIWRELEPAHQPLQAWSDALASSPLVIGVVTIGLLSGGLAMLIGRSRRFGAAVLMILYGAFVLFPVPRLWVAPHYLGHHLAVYIGVLVDVCQQMILCLAAAVVWRGAREAKALRGWVLARWLFGICAVVFGLGHLTAVRAVAPMIPGWMPGQASFWVVLTGVAFVLAGVAIALDCFASLAAYLLGWMLLVFSVTVLTPGIASDPHAHVAWGGDAYNLTAVGACWIVAGWLAVQSRPTTMIASARRS